MLVAILSNNIVRAGIALLAVIAVVYGISTTGGDTETTASTAGENTPTTTTASETTTTEGATTEETTEDATTETTEE